MMICPVCNQEGQAITCTAGNQERAIVYHPEKPIHNVCNIAIGGTSNE